MYFVELARFAESDMSKEDASVGQRRLRVAEEVRHALAWILERNESRDPVLAAVAVALAAILVVALAVLLLAVLLLDRR